MIEPTARRRGLLQTFRAFQAIAEVEPVAIPEAERSWWEAGPFELQWAVGTGTPVTVEVDHDAPMTAIGHVTRPLIYPHQFFGAYRKAWTGRTVRASFMGRIGRTRKVSLARWQRQNGKAAVSESDVGKRWPGKAWDQAYVSTLAATRFALCPVSYFSEKVTWTYRFFEACAAGALPIVDQVSPLYEGFVYGSMADPVGSFEWTEEVAEANYARALHMLTVPHEEIRDAW